MSHADGGKVKRFLDKVTPVTESGCWLWTAACYQSGYGSYRVGGKSYRAHRFSYELFNGTIPSGKELNHICRVKCCVNPTHLEAVTRIEHANRPHPKRKRKTHCKYGHAFDAANTYIDKRGDYLCMACRRGWQKEHRRLRHES